MPTLDLPWAEPLQWLWTYQHTPVDLVLVVSFPGCGNAQACISQAESLIAVLVTNLPLAHVLPAQDEGDTHSLALLYSSPTF